MRSPNIHQDSLFSTINPAVRVTKHHPLWPIRAMVDTALKGMIESLTSLKHSRNTHESKPDKDALLFKKSQGATTRLSDLIS